MKFFMIISNILSTSLHNECIILKIPDGRCKYYSKYPSSQALQNNSCSGSKELGEKNDDINENSDEIIRTLKEKQKLLSVLKQQISNIQKENDELTDDKTPQETSDDPQMVQNFLKLINMAAQNNNKKTTAVKKSPRNKIVTESSNVITVTRVETSTVSVDRPITLYREIVRKTTVTKPIINYSVTTFTEEKIINSTMTVVTTETKYPTKTDVATKIPESIFVNDKVRVVTVTARPTNTKVCKIKLKAIDDNTILCKDVDSGSDECCRKTEVRNEISNIGNEKKMIVIKEVEGNNNQNV